MRYNAFTPTQRAALVDLRRTLPERRIVLIGASALGCQIEMNWRSTNDLDLTVVADQIELAAELRALGWVRNERFEQRWSSPHGVIVDVLPATPANLDDGTMTFANSGHVMNLTGFDLALMHYISVTLDNETFLDVATVPVIIVLKMAAWLDRPSERERDLEDLAHVLNEYLAPDDVRRWQEAIIDAGLPYDDQSAFALGQDVGAIVAEVHMRVIDQFTRAMSDDASASYAHFARCLGATNPSTTLGGRLQAFQLGLNCS